MEVNTGSNFIPLKITHLNAEVYDLDTNKKVGTGDMYGLSLAAKKFLNIQIPVNFTYVADNSSDITCEIPSSLASGFLTTDISTGPGANWYNACKNHGLYSDGKRPGTFSRYYCSRDVVSNVGIFHLSREPQASASDLYSRCGLRG
jgi:hypothetical protein